MHASKLARPCSSRAPWMAAAAHTAMWRETYVRMYHAGLPSHHDKQYGAEHLTHLDLCM